MILVMDEKNSKKADENAVKSKPQDSAQNGKPASRFLEAKMDAIDQHKPRWTIEHLHTIGENWDDPPASSGEVSDASYPPHNIDRQSSETPQRQGPDIEERKTLT